NFVDDNTLINSGNPLACPMGLGESRMSGSSCRLKTSIFFILIFLAACILCLPRRCALCGYPDLGGEIDLQVRLRQAQPPELEVKNPVHYGIIAQPRGRISGVGSYVAVQNEQIRACRCFL